MRNVVTEIERDGIIKSAIHIGNDKFGLPGHFMTGEKIPGIITDGKSIENWMWEGLTVIDGERYIFFDKCFVEPIGTISSVHRKDALKLINMIAFALMKATEEFLDLEGGIFPLYRIYVYEGEKILLLPPDIGDLFSVIESNEEKYMDTVAPLKGNAEKNFMLITEMAELMYYAATGILPYAPESVRRSGYKSIGIGELSVLTDKTAGFITFILNAGNREMRDIMGNRPGGGNLAWFLERSDLEWNLKNRTEEECDDEKQKILNSPLYMNFISKCEKRARINRFWRVKGTLIVTLTVLTVLIGGFLYSYISSALEPPATRDLNEEEIIEDVYIAQSNLDTVRLTAATAGCKLPQELEVTGFYVTSTTRRVYENNSDAIISAIDWVNSGKPPIPKGSVIYGVVLDSVTEIDDEKFLAIGTWYLPTPYGEEETVPMDSRDGSIQYIYKYKIAQSFEFHYNKRGWWNIVDSKIESYEFIGIEEIPVYSGGN